jgi:hypothetical protein
LPSATHHRPARRWARSGPTARYEVQMAEDATSKQGLRVFVCSLPKVRLIRIRLDTSAREMYLHC